MSHVCLSVQVTDMTKGPFNLMKLLRFGSSASGYAAGVTVTPTAFANGYGELNVDGVQTYLSVQNDPTGTTGNLFIGNSAMDVNGAGRGLVMQGGDIDVQQGDSPRIPISDYNMAVDTNNVVINIRVYTR